LSLHPECINIVARQRQYLHEAVGSLKLVILQQLQERCLQIIIILAQVVSWFVVGSEIDLVRCLLLVERNNFLFIRDWTLESHWEVVYEHRLTLRARLLIIEEAKLKPKAQPHSVPQFVKHGLVLVHLDVLDLSEIFRGFAVHLKLEIH